MEPTSVLTILTILATLFMIIVYILQTAEMVEKRIAQLINWLRNRKRKQEPPPSEKASQTKE